MALRKNYSPEEKAKIALEMLSGKLTQNEITAKYKVHSSQIYHWVKKLKEGIAEIFRESKAAKQDEQAVLVEELYKQIGQQKVELDWLKKKSALFS